MHSTRKIWARPTSGINLSRSAEALAQNSASRVNAQVPRRCGVGTRRSCPGFVGRRKQRRRGAGEQVAAPQVAAPVRGSAWVNWSSRLQAGPRLPATLGELYRWAAMRAVVICCALLAFSTGCFLGDRMGTGKEVSVTIPMRVAKSSPSPTSPEVQEAVQIVAKLVVSYGLLRDTNIPPRKAQNAIAYFHDQYTHTYCTIYLNDDTLTTWLYEYGHHASPEFKRLGNQVRRELRSRYGFPRKD
jgi:hypothetical protein